MCVTVLMFPLFVVLVSLCVCYCFDVSFICYASFIQVFFVLHTEAVCCIQKAIEIYTDMVCIVSIASVVRLIV